MRRPNSTLCSSSSEFGKKALNMPKRCTEQIRTMFSTLWKKDVGHLTIFA